MLSGHARVAGLRLVASGSWASACACNASSRAIIVACACCNAAR